jgi:WD40 repeat protein
MPPRRRFLTWTGAFAMTSFHISRPVRSWLLCSVMACAGVWAVNRLEEASHATAVLAGGSVLDHDVSVQSLTFTPDGRQLVIGGGVPVVGDQLRIWDAEPGRRPIAFTAHNTQILAAAFAADGQLVTASCDAVKYWNPSTGELLRTLSLHQLGRHTPVIALSRDGQRLALADLQGGPVRLCDLTTGTTRDLGLGEREVTANVAFSPDGDFLAAGGTNSRVWLWDVQTGQERARARCSGGLITALAVARGGSRVWCGLGGPAIEIWDTARDTPAVVCRGHDQRQWTQCLALSADGRLLVSGNLDGTVHVWEADTGAPVGILGEHRDWVRALAFSPDGRCLASGGQDRVVRIWDLAHLSGLNSWWSGENSAADGQRLPQFEKLQSIAVGVSMRPRR